MNAVLGTPPGAPEPRGREFRPPVFDAWLERLCGQGQCAFLVGVLLKLARLAQAPVDGPRRLAIMRALIPIVADLADDLPTNPPPSGPLGTKVARHTLVQRLGHAAYINLKRTLEALDQGGAGLLGAHADGRLWLVEQMFACLGRQIELGAGWGKSWPPNTWQELHDLAAYCANRLQPLRAAAREPGTPDPAGLACAALTAYKRLLMVGLCAEEDAGPLWLSVGAERFEAWARASELCDAAARFGVIGAWLVDPFGDAPARRVAGALGSGPQTRVLVLPPDFLAALAAAKAGLRAPTAS